MEVTGRDRVMFFRRPILPNTMPLPYIRYAREISQSVDDIKKRDKLKEEARTKHVTINEPFSQQKVMSLSISYAYNSEKNKTLRYITRKLKYYLLFFTATAAIS